MESIPVTTGVTWLDIPEADLFILCGSPADIMKHLKQKGFVIPKVKHGTYYESGPNAILLSDVPVQHGQFSNLSEFPILHMLYFQGMGIPEHINNTGKKPILIGSESQINAQLSYIYRGRYGLATEEEIRQSGISEDWAKELYRIKNYYAYNHIQPTEETIDSVIVGKESSEIAPGVKIKRLKTNVFRIEHKDEAIEVDLNLKPGTNYEPAVALDFHLLEKDYFSIIHIGDGDGWAINKPCMGSLLIFQGKLYLIDAGPFVLNNLQSLGISINELEGIFHTHLHDDHFAGLTSLMYTDHRLKYFSSPLVRQSVMKKLSALMGLPESTCEKAFEIHDLNLHKWNDIEGLQVFPSYSPHPVETNVFLFRTPWEGGFKQYMHLADISSLDLLEKMLIKDDQANPISQGIYRQMKKLIEGAVNIKKVDIGGGMIHGEAEDFQVDKQSKILLSHTGRKLNFKEKEIGSSASFGLADVLIPSNRDYYMKSAYNYLSRYFPDVPVQEIQLLLNNDIIIINVGDIIIKKELAQTPLFLILSGVVEVIDRENERSYTLPAGSIIGETSMLLDKESRYTYRAASFVRALKISRKLAKSFMVRNYNIKQYLEIQKTIQIFQTSDLFGEMLAADTQSIIARMANPKRFKKGSEIEIKKPEIFYLISSGSVELSLENTIVETIGRGDFFGEENFFYQSSLMKAITLENSVIYEIPFSCIENIPVIEWKMQETMERRILSFGIQASER